MHHRRIATVLESLDAALLREHGCLFGGGTAIALRHGEYRESVDIDFLISDVAGYRALRQRLNSRDGFFAIARAQPEIAQTRDVRADQYGIRTMLNVSGVDIKFEIVLEARIELALPTLTDRICGVATATVIDLAATKMLSNSDRWADDSVNNRDLIDLAMLHLDTKTLRLAVAKAQIAYGASVVTDLQKAIAALQRRSGRLVACMEALQMMQLPEGLAPVPPAVLWKEIKRLGRVLTPQH